MKRILYIAGAVLSVAAIAGCNDFLDKTPDNRTEVDSQDKVASILGSAYSNTDFQLLTEYMSDNVDDYGASNPYYDKFIEQVYKWENVTEDNNESPQNIWESNYNAIASANQALDAIEQLGGVDESATLRECKGEALLARAYCHYVLVNIFCNAYNQNTSVKDLGIPYVTESEKTLNPHYERGTVADVYAKLEKDITEGLTLIGDNHLKTPKYHFNTQAAYAFASKFYLSYEKWDKAKECADLCLGSVPTLMDWASNSALPADPIVRGEDYISSDNSNNLLLETAYSALGLAIGPYSRYSRFAHGFYLANNETAAALHPFGSYTNFKCPMFFVTATSIQKAMLLKVPVLFEYTDPVAGIGFLRTVFVNLSTDMCILDRAEAEIMLKQYDAAAADLTTWQNNYVNSGSQMTLTPENIQKFYSGIEYSTGLSSTIKKHLHPSFSIDAEGSLQECMLQCLLDYRRLQTLHEGQRWFDIKRYGIVIYRRTINAAGIPETLTDSLTVNDPRRAVQIPDKVVNAGIEPNPRNN